MFSKKELRGIFAYYRKSRVIIICFSSFFFLKYKTVEEILCGGSRKYICNRLSMETPCAFSGPLSKLFPVSVNINLKPALSDLVS